jgi:hypothetical protein
MRHCCDEVCFIGNKYCLSYPIRLYVQQHPVDISKGSMAMKHDNNKVKLK